MDAMQNAVQRAMQRHQQAELEALQPPVLEAPAPEEQAADEAPTISGCLLPPSSVIIGSNKLSGCVVCCNTVLDNLRGPGQRRMRVEDITVRTGNMIQDWK